jgi:hypothetical protein
MSVTRVHYDAREYRSAARCLADISARLRDGWTLSEVGREAGRFLAVFRAPADGERAGLGADEGAPR